VIDKVVSVIHFLSRLCGVIAAFLLASACVVVCYMVIIRYLLGQSTIWQYEFVIFAVVSATLIGSPYVLLTRGHVNVNLVPHFLNFRARKYLALFSSFLAFLGCAVLAWASWLYFYEAWVNDWRTPSIWAPPLWIPTLPLAIGFSLLSLQFLADIYSIFTNKLDLFKGFPIKDGIS
jgi:TRAP-type C4-dicarboxylate transport system permease small subunit